MIGIFDSGSGGLTVLKALREKLPSSNIVYFGDIKNAPYGSKTREELSQLTIEGMQFLYERGCRSIVSACNSVSASLAISLFDTLAIEPTHLIEMVGPTVSTFRGASERPLLVATPATILSGIYQNAFRMVGIETQTLPLDGLAGAIEFGKSNEEIKSIIVNGFKSIDHQSYDIIILACTHYPLVTNLFKEVLGNVPLFDPADAVAERALHRFWPREVGEKKLTFCISKDSDTFRKRVATLFPNVQYVVEVV